MDATPENAVRIAVHSERRLVREALCAYLDALPEFDVVGRIATMAQLAELCALCQPQVVLLDVGLLNAETVLAVHRLQLAHPNIEIVLTYAVVSPAAVEAALQAGITSLIPSTHGLSALLHLLRARAQPMTVRPASDGLTLTRRELAVVTLLGSGHGTAEIADLLEISPHTVENHKRSIYGKLGVGHQSHAVSRATLLGLLNGPAAPGYPSRPPAEPGRATVVVVHGAPGANLDRVASAVLGPGLALVLIRATGLLGRDHWARWHRGMLLTVLVDPCEDSWLMAAELAAPTVVVHTTAPQLAWVVDALLRGVHAMIAGDDVPADLGAMLTLVARGYFTMSADYLEPLVAMMAKRVNEGGSGLPELTTREQDILASIASGDTIRQTARALGIAAKTVENTQARLFRKLGTRNRSETLTIAYRLGLVDPATSSDPAAQSETAR